MTPQGPAVPSSVTVMSVVLVFMEKGGCEGWKSPSHVESTGDQALFSVHCPAGVNSGCPAYLYAAPTCPSSQPDPSPSPGAPHSASSTSLHSEHPHSSAWAASRPEGLHQRSCSVSSTDQWSEAAALPTSVQHPGEWLLSPSTSSGICPDAQEPGGLMGRAQQNPSGLVPGTVMQG